MDNNKTNVESIDEYIAAFSPEVQQILQEIRQGIRDSAPEAREKISYQMPTFEQHGNLVHFAAYSNHIGFYPAPSGIEAFKEELAGYKSSKGAIQFPLAQPVPLELISRIVKFRVAENAEKAALKKEAKKKRK
ncbi:hypothetical protein GCM10010912_53200 [Paenibacillus albidus]|uniref:YdhG-like domain-containing protein n=1 Tax=Paenibacillus albidus TaxID=2041023 RepID=A0A917CZD4_9BACL|nr:DUF1801 domain-containing protein [Paenibacillus albidus]GGG01705.1 hypothetical protein GCM10010912_53200 [Paenibacillus albidus]